MSSNKKIAEEIVTQLQNASSARELKEMTLGAAQEESNYKKATPARVFYKKLCDPKFVRENLKKAIEHSWSLGIPVVQQDSKGIYELYKDGSKKYIEIF